MIYEDLAKLCNCDEDDVPVDLDLLKAYNTVESERCVLLVSDADVWNSFVSIQLCPLQKFRHLFNAPITFTKFM